MIGCEPLCGRCPACIPLTFALDWLSRQTPEAVKLFTREPGRLSHELPILRYAAAKAALVPEEVAGMFPRALRGRGLDAWALCTWVPGSICPQITIHTAIDHRNVRVGGGTLRMPQAREALARLLALPLDCGADVAERALTP